MFLFGVFYIKYTLDILKCNTRPLLPLKDPIIHKANVIYKEKGTYKEFYIGEC